MKQFEKGDPVMLQYRQEGQTYQKFMYILDYNVHGEVICFWHDEQRNWHSGVFPEAMLTKYTQEPPRFIDVGW